MLKDVNYYPIPKGFSPWLRNLISKGEFRQADICEETGLSPSYVSSLVNGRTVRIDDAKWTAIYDFLEAEEHLCPEKLDARWIFPEVPWLRQEIQQLKDYMNASNVAIAEILKVPKSSLSRFLNSQPIQPEIIMAIQEGFREFNKAHLQQEEGITVEKKSVIEIAEEPKKSPVSIEGLPTEVELDIREFHLIQRLRLHIRGLDPKPPTTPTDKTKLNGSH